MNSWFNIHNPIGKFLERLWDIVCLNLLFLLCCIPVITIGTAVTALYYCMLKISRGQDCSSAGMYIHSFRNNLKQGSFLTLFFAVLYIFVLVDIQACNIIDIELIKYIKIILYIVLVVLIMVTSYVFPLLAQFENTNIALFKNAFFMSIINFRYTCAIIILNVIPILLFISLPQLFLLSFPVWLTFGFSVIVLINSKMFVKMFDQFIE